MADAAFSELDAGELRFALAEPAPQTPGNARWHTLELGGTPKSKPPPKSPFSKTLPPPWMGELEPEPPLAALSPPSIPMSVPPLPRIPRIADSLPLSMIVPPDRPTAAPAKERDVPGPLLASLGDASMRVTARAPSWCEREKARQERSRVGSTRSVSSPGP